MRTTRSYWESDGRALWMRDALRVEAALSTLVGVAIAVTVFYVAYGSPSKR